MIQGFSPNYSYKLITDRAEAIRRAVIEAEDGDTLLLIGKGAEEYNIDASGYHSFNEREILLSAIKEREENEH